MAIVLAILLWLNPIAAPIVFAEELTEPTPTETQPTINSEVTPTPAPVSTIDTGDANAQATTETTANTNQDTVAGTITTPEGGCTPPEGQTTCPNDININNSNTAGVTDETNSSATTGQNQESGAQGDVVVTTGDATAAGTITNKINDNTVTLETTPTSTVEQSTEPTATPTQQSASEGQDKSLNVNNNNEATVGNEANISSQTGQNLASENLGDVQLTTGDALALANILNLLNTNIVGSNFEILLLNILGEQDGDINLNELWKQLEKAQGTDSLTLVGETEFSNLIISVQNQNQANLTNEVNVTAGTGENQANQNNNVNLQTGDATALANVTNIVNTNLLGSKFFFGIINILGSINGNLILPRPETFASQIVLQGLEAGGGPVVFDNQNKADIQDNVGALADSGNNQANNNAGENSLVTGNAQAKANSFSLVNLNIWGNNWFFLMFNNLGNWTGKTMGWSSPGGVETPSEGNQINQTGFNQPTGEGQDVVAENLVSDLTFQNQNQASVRNNIQTSALTGGNQANNNQGDVTMQTGNAKAATNLFNLVNLNILGGRWFMGLVNILGDWSGNAIFAYPDVVVGVASNVGEVTPGQTVEYTLHYKNQGYDEAKDVKVEFELPQGTAMIGDSSGIVPTISGSQYSWLIGTLGMGEEKAFVIKIKINDDFAFGESLSFWSKIIPQVRAAANEKEGRVVVYTSISTQDPESDVANNNSSTTTLVYLPEPSSGGDGGAVVDQRQPKLEISAKNNVNDFVYAADTVSFEVIIKNTGEVPAYNSYFLQKLYNGAPEDFGTVKIELGTIEPGKEGKLTFGIKMADGVVIPDGDYRTIAQVIGEAPNGEKVSSNEARTDFKIKVKNALGNLLEAKAIGKEEEVLGSAVATECPKDKDILPYVLLFLLSSGYITTWGKASLEKKLKLK